MHASDFELFSVTVVGPSQCGKTTLINAFVNNTFLQVGEVTDSPQLYYKTLSIPAASSAEGSASATTPILAEVEDTPPCDSEQKAYGHGFRKQQLSIEHENQAAQGERTELITGYDMPPVKEHRPLGRRRMAFIFVFDANSAESAKAAREAYLDMQSQNKQVEQYKNVVIYLVANMVDKDPTSPEYLQNVSSAKKFAESSGLRFFDVSAKDFRNVKKLFRSVLVDIQSKPALWRHNATRHSWASDADLVEDMDAAEFDSDDLDLEHLHASQVEHSGLLQGLVPDVPQFQEVLGGIEQQRQKILKDTEDCTVQ
eukprot:TRINITY_DN51392_c0_g1_i1.p1 TRINITY_DN51392_c0_g1~~TRINITY_DN51392_c0_g1_i1.p1  ORF type:complete len:312 (-),score=75.59 TRINITY_DN51392_c0_g1_i1:105-1040(-)